jgi:hypothetical protein
MAGLLCILNEPHTKGKTMKSNTSKDKKDGDMDSMSNKARPRNSVNSSIPDTRVADTKLWVQNLTKGKIL